MRKTKAHFLALAITGLLVSGMFLPTAATSSPSDYQAVPPTDDDDGGFFIIDTKWIFYKVTASGPADPNAVDHVLSKYGQ